MTFSEPKSSKLDTMCWSSFQHMNVALIRSKSILHPGIIYIFSRSGKMQIDRDVFTIQIRCRIGILYGRIHSTEKGTPMEFQTLITRQEAAQLLRMSVCTLDNARKEGRIEYIQHVPRGCVYFTVDSLNDFLKRGTHMNTPAQPSRSPIGMTFRKPRNRSSHKPYLR